MSKIMGNNFKDNQHCKLRNYNGSECGTCDCKGPYDCPDRPKVTPMGMRITSMVDQHLAKLDEASGIKDE